MNLNSGDASTYNGTWANIINQKAQKYGVDPWLIACVIQQESGFKQDGEISPAGAIGAMQLMPGTAKSLGVNPYNLDDNIDGGTKLLSQLLRANNGDVALALAGYNAGQGAVEKYHGIPPYPETQNYVKSILANYSKHNAGVSLNTGQGQAGQTTDNATSTGVKAKVETIVKSPIFWVVLLAGLVFKS